MSSSNGANGSLIANSAIMREKIALIRRIAELDKSVLLLGETGVGKDALAEHYHQNSPRKDKPFLGVNCAALNEQLLESELFGHEKGSFTGAHQQHIGLFEQAHGGTLFLNEVADTSGGLQAKLLQGVQFGRIRRVGGKEDIQVDVRILAATHQNLLDMVNDGSFRQDLYYRLSVFPLKIPPLRERGADILELANYFLSKEPRKHVLSSEACDVLERHDWPGNVRELQNVISRACLIADLAQLDRPSTTTILDSHLLFDESTSPQTEGGFAVIESSAQELRFTVPLLPGLAAPELHQRTIDACEKSLFLHLLRAHQGNQASVCRVLGISRGSLRTKLQKLGIKITGRRLNQ